MDTTQPSQATQITYGGINKGHNKSIETTESHSLLKIIGVLNPKEIGSEIIRRDDTVTIKLIVVFGADARADNNNNTRIHMILE